MNNLYDLVVSLLGTPPNTTIQYLYYILVIYLVVYILKIFYKVLASIFKF